ncbi:uncharacterized protein N7515_008367 [Penicillium bovifimosum]|uniref:SGNH hydrolase-type esterase domain-containing protein n=1 Tax=Penicillium bovifimosum TaxID=126998 RepID=A0A9W9KXF5_9EURO|nr:uncharacterized protein N7515_008367 [Penicillium bovifimosum]KAJ5124542.1 hypothetical protein N7515_008367 [Penicillium bovifimosum]
MRQSTPIYWVVQACLLWLAIVRASAIVPTKNLISAPASDSGDDVSTLRSRDTKPFLLRILPFGASITMGYKSPDGNGYREWLRQQLRYAGWEVDMVGTLQSGTMHDNDHEGRIGMRIDQLSKIAKNIIPLQPNLILLNAGTNDALQEYKVETASERMDSLLTQLFDGIPGTTIILSTLIFNGIHPQEVADISGQYVELAGKRRAQNDSLVLADMSTFIKWNELVDNIHPTAEGYERMASVWWAAIQEAEKEGLLKAPKSTSTNSGTISKAYEKELDDSISNPSLPAYTASPQPTVVERESGSSRSRWQLWAVSFQMIAMCVAFSGL